jgi:phosphatidate phosphatase APP1
MNTNVVVMGLAISLSLFVQRGWAATEDTVVIYPAISSGGAVIIEGRVVERKNKPEPTSTDRKRDNFNRTMTLMMNNERKHYPIALQLGGREWQATTDQEGYFRIEADNSKELAPGWHTVTGKTAHGEGTADLLVVPMNNTHGLISDIDDTVQVTEVNHKTRTMTNTFMLNPLQRQVVPGIVPFYRELSQANAQPELAPIIYLSASPRQLHTNINLFLTHNQFPRGVLITKRVTDDSTSEPLMDQVAYKTGKIEALLSQLPGIRFTLIGDDGDLDPEIYAAIRQRFPERIAAIWIRHVNPDPKRTRIVGEGILNDELVRYLPIAVDAH